MPLASTRTIASSGAEQLGLGPLLDRDLAGGLEGDRAHRAGNLYARGLETRPKGSTEGG